ncbi:MAG TPA: beta-ketoacyl-[acyl-carrier-protein] synthase family protein [Pyrinomonadaceae bacterium]|nr:beta-ketoacyl-[acyl-carrier-protein] synthase family protein [Pyrinomonadaceae bacterium]
MRPRVVITGIGLVTPVGAGRERVWDNLLAGRSGVTPVESFDAARYGVRFGAEVKDFRPGDYLPDTDASSMGRASQFAVAAARMALADAGVAPGDLEPGRAGVSMGTTSGEPREVERFDDLRLAGEEGRLGAEFAARYPCHRIPANVAGALGLSGVNLMTPAACAAGNYAIAYAADALAAGRADLMLAGGSDSFSRITYAGFARLGAIAPERCQPFDRNRRGMIPGEGACVLVLETLRRAARRGARAYAEVAGYGLTCDAHHMTAAHPEGDGAARVMAAALADAGLRPEDVDYISAHGTGTPTNDRLETVAVKRLFKEHAYRVPMSSIKSMIGHTMGAASAVEAAVCALAVREGRVPPTVNLEEPDPECDLDYVPGRARELRVDVAMNNAYAFGGNNSSLVLRRCEVTA